MLRETQSAAKYWASTISSKLNNSQQLHEFEETLLRLMSDKFATHWHFDNPIKGQAFREIACDIENKFIDDLLIQAAKTAGFNFASCYSYKRGIRMWVDPGEVEVSFINPPYRRQVIYQQQSLSNSPVSISPSSSPEPVYPYYYAPTNYVNNDYTVYYPEHHVPSRSMYIPYGYQMNNYNPYNFDPIETMNNYPVQYDMQSYV